MFERFYGFSAAPFQLSPDPRFFFPSSVHQKAKSYLMYGLHQGEGFIIITGDVGAGKTTLVSHLLDTLNHERVVAANVVSTQLGADDMLRLIALSFGLEARSVEKATLLQDIKEFFASHHAAGRRCLLIVDEAQNLPMATLEELRMLSNFQIGPTSPLQCFLLGQPQFRAQIAHRDLEQLRQRIIVSYHLGPIGTEDTRCYIEHRLKTVGWTTNPEIAGSAFAAIYEATSGVPRRINKLCARLLLFGCIEERHRLTSDDVATVVAEMRAEFDDRVRHETGGTAEHCDISSDRPPSRARRPATGETVALAAEAERRIASLEEASSRQERLMRQVLSTTTALLEVDQV